MDMHDHIMLKDYRNAEHPHAYVLLRLNEVCREPYVLAYGYDEETKEWQQGRYYADFDEAVNDARADIGCKGYTLDELLTHCSVDDVIEEYKCSPEEAHKVLTAAKEDLLCSEWTKQELLAYIGYML